MDQNGKCTLPKHRCIELYGRMMQAMNGELTLEQEEQFLLEVQQYPCCFEKFDLARSYKQFICTRLQRKAVPIQLIVSIKSKVQELSTQIQA